MSTNGHLYLSFTPDAIREYFSRYPNDSLYEWVMNASYLSLMHVGQMCIDNCELLEAYDLALTKSISTKKELEENDGV